MNIEEILNKVYTSELLSGEELHELTEWICKNDEEIERLNDYIKFYEDLSKKQNKEIERLNNIINKAIEYIKELDYESEELYDICELARNYLLYILQGSDKQ